MKPRFYVGSLTGFTIAEGGGVGRKLHTDWHVYDRAFNCRMVRMYRGFLAEMRARNLAENLNEEYEQWLATL